MASAGTGAVRAGQPAEHGEPFLEFGDRLTRSEFERRYSRMPGLKKAELIEGIVYMPSPVRVKNHGEPHSRMAAWLGFFAAHRPELICADNATVRLDLDNEPQPDLVLIKRPESGGQCKVSPDDYLEGAPEMVVEIVGTSAAYDLHQKKAVYRRNGVTEYLVWVTGEQRLYWWTLTDGDYVELPSESGVTRSHIFPGLWLDTAAMLRGDMKTVLAVLQDGVNSVSHS